MGFLKNVANVIGKVTSAVGAITNPVGSLIGLGTSLLENKSNRDAQAEANQTNMQIAQMNNEYNERMMEKQMAYNTDMWNKETAYNTPAAQMQRLKEAGFNPAMFMGQGNTGQASGALGVSPPTAQAATMQAYNSGGSITQALQQGYLADLATQKQEIEIKALQQQMQLQTLQTMADITDKYWDSMTKKQQEQWQKTQNLYADDLFATEIENRRMQFQIYFEQSKQAAYDSVMKFLDAKNYPDKIKLELANLGAELGLKYASKELTQNQAETELEKKLETIERKNNIQLDNDLKDAIFENEVVKSYKDAYGSGNIVQFITSGIAGHGNIIKDKIQNRYKGRRNE